MAVVAACLRYVQREITVSHQDFDRLKRWYWPLRNKFLPIYHSRISDEANPVVNPQPRLPVILAVGHIATRKGQMVLAEAFSKIAERHPDWKLWLAGHVGEANCQQQIAQLASQLSPGKIEMLGQHDDAPKLMRQAAIYVQPSFHEGLPLSLQEALWHGCACIATEIPGNIELVEHERNGLLVPPGNVAAMATALERIIGDEDLRTRFAITGYDTIRRLEMTTAQMTRKHQNLYAAILNQS